MYSRLFAHSFAVCRPRFIQPSTHHTVALTSQSRRWFATPRKPAINDDTLDNVPPAVRRLLATEADTILYSSYVDSLQPGWLESSRQLRRQQRDREADARSSAAVRPFSAALQFMQDPQPARDQTANPATTVVHDNTVERLEESDESNSSAQSSSNSAAWMHDYESFNDPDSDTTTGVYGTPDPAQPFSKVPCHGCGALLHCAEPSLPGYLPSEIFVGQKVDYLKVYNSFR